MARCRGHHCREWSRDSLFGAPSMLAVSRDVIPASAARIDGAHRRTTSNVRQRRGRKHSHCPSSQKGHWQTTQGALRRIVLRPSIRMVLSPRNLSTTFNLPPRDPSQLSRTSSSRLCGKHEKGPWRRPAPLPHPANVTSRALLGSIREMQRPGGFNVTRQPAVSAVNDSFEIAPNVTSGRRDGIG